MLKVRKRIIEYLAVRELKRGQRLVLEQIALDVDDARHEVVRADLREPGATDLGAQGLGARRGDAVPRERLRGRQKAREVDGARRRARPCAPRDRTGSSSPRGSSWRSALRSARAADDERALSAWCSKKRSRGCARSRARGACAR